MKPNGVTIRPAEPADAQAVIGLLGASFADYAAFAPPGWQPPHPTQEELEWTAAKFDDPRVWYRVAEDQHGHAGQCGFNPAYSERWMRGDPIPGLAHFWQLFVRPDWFGRGLAAYLHDAALAAMPARGFTRARLVTPAGQARARRFYQKRGWQVTDTEVDPGEMRIPLVEYAIELSA